LEVVVLAVSLLLLLIGDIERDLDRSNTLVVRSKMRDCLE